VGICCSKSAMPYVKSYLDEWKGRAARNRWTDIAISKSRAERLDYQTQKPLAILRRIIEASSNPMIPEALQGRNQCLGRAPERPRFGARATPSVPSM
jgi:hypothetical protein